MQLQRQQQQQNTGILHFVQDDDVRGLVQDDDVRELVQDDDVRVGSGLRVKELALDDVRVKG